MSKLSIDSRGTQGLQKDEKYVIIYFVFLLDRISEEKNGRGKDRRY